MKYRSRLVRLLGRRGNHVKAMPSFFEHLERRSFLSAGSPQLVADINPGMASSRASSQSDIVAMGSYVYFTRDDGVHDSELWRSDGSAEGTLMVKDINPTGGSDPESLVALGSVLYFNAYDDTHGYELWKSDGTEAGTVMVKDISPGSDDSYPRAITQVNSLIYFFANQCELWKSDGTEAGTTMVKRIESADFASGSITAFNGMAFFRCDDGIHGVELWKSDGSANGTVMVKDINTTIADDDFDTGTLGSSPGTLAPFNGALYFRADDFVHGVEIWKTDGTAAGTVIVKDFAPGAATSNAYPSLAGIGSSFYFAADDGVRGTELWKSNGTAAGTVLVKDTHPGRAGLVPEGASVGVSLVNGKLLFPSLDDDNKIMIWTSDGTAAGTKPVASAGTIDGGTFMSDPALVGNTLYFVGYDSAYGYEVWKYDGTAAGSGRVSNFGPSSRSTRLNNLAAAADGTLYFFANDGVHGEELWKISGAGGGSQGGNNPLDIASGLGSIKLTPAVIAGTSAKGTAPVVITNAGTAALGKTQKVNLRLVAHHESGDDIPLVQKLGQSIASLSIGGTKTFMMPFTMPSSLSAGTYYVTVIAELVNATESNLANNQAQSTSTYVVAPAFVDLSVAAGTSNMEIEAGSTRSQKLSVVVTNLGNQSVPSGKVVVVTLAARPSNASDSSGDILLGSVTSSAVAGLPKGKSKAIAAPFTLGTKAPVGNYIFVVRLDASSVNDLNAANDIAMVQALTVTRSPVTLKVTRFVFPVHFPIYSRQDMSFTLVNTGGLAIINQTVDFYVSTLNRLGSHATHLDDYTITYLAPGAAVSQTMEPPTYGIAYQGLSFYIMMVVDGRVIGSLKTRTTAPEE